MFFKCRLPTVVLGKWHCYYVSPVSQLALTLFQGSFISFKPITSPFSDCKMQVNRLQPILHWLTFVPNLGKSNHYNCKPLFREPLIHWKFLCGLLFVKCISFSTDKLQWLHENCRQYNKEKLYCSDPKMAVKKVYGAFVKLPLLGSNTRPPYIPHI